jgi:hypothetical protein
MGKLDCLPGFRGVAPIERRKSVCAGMPAVVEATVGRNPAEVDNDASR